jgi:tetratricopeptide (TPR) repeat protein
MPFLNQSTFHVIHTSMDFAAILAATGRNHEFSGFLIFIAIIIASIPMIIAHEFGHLIAGRLMGLHIREFNIGSGKILWQHKIRGTNFIVRCIPMSGYVLHMPSEETPRFKQFVFILGGPAVNLFIAGYVSWWSGVNITDLFDQPTLPTIVVVSNLFLGIGSLIPIANHNSISIVPGNDGWQLLRLLRGKNIRLNPEEITKLRSTVGLARLQAYSRRTHKIQYVIGGFCLIMTLAVGLTIIPVTRAIFDTHVDPSPYIAEISIIGVIIIIFLSFLALGILNTRKARIKFVNVETRKKFNPLMQQALQYQHLIVHQAKQWDIIKIQEDDRMKMITSYGNPDLIPFLCDLQESYPQVPFINLSLYDSLMCAERFKEANKVISEVLERDDLPETFRSRLEICKLSAKLGESADSDTIALCQKSIDSNTDEGMKMWYLVDLASTIVDAKHTHQLDQAVKWCKQAHDIYPYDASVFLQTAIISLEKNDLESVQSNLKNAKEVAYDSNRTLISAWMAIFAALRNMPRATKLLDQCLANPLPFRLKKRLEDARSNLQENPI